MKEPSEWDALIQKHLDGQTTTEEATALSAQIVADGEVRSRYLKAARVHAVLADEVLALDLETEPSQSAVLKEQRRVIWRFAWPRQIAAGLVAGLFVGLLVWGVLVWLSGKPSLPELGIARVIRVEGEVLVDGKRALAGGNELFAAENVSITNGLIELAFRETGVHVLATAPLSIQLHSTERMFLHQGEMKVVVPPQGVGFVVDTPERKITDLGTSFVVKAGREGSKVFVLEGQVAVDEPAGGPQQLMFEGEVAEFGQGGKVKRRSRGHPDIPELSWLPPEPAAKSLTGILLGYQDSPDMAREKPGSSRGVIAQQVLPLVRSGFHDRTCLEGLKQERLRFSGIAGSYSKFPERAGLAPGLPEHGWMAWYHGRVVPPSPGKYRFWGYADNHLLVAVNGEPVFEGSRRNSVFKQLGIPRTDSPSLPCLNAMAGFACGPWVELGEEPVQLDILFGEKSGNLTSGLLLVERAGEVYEDTYWGQPRWPIFLTEPPTESLAAEMENLRQQMEARLMGSFSTSANSIWRVVGN